MQIYNKGSLGPEPCVGSWVPRRQQMTQPRVYKEETAHAS
jgi:hypothetical protein